MRHMRLLVLGLVALATLILITSSGAQTLIRTLETPNPQPDGHFGGKVAIADINGDGKADVAVGAALEDVGGLVDAGRVYVFSGSDNSLLFAFEGAEAGAGCGSGVAAGDVNSDGKADVAMGCPLEDVGSNVNQGRAYVFSGVDGSVLCNMTTPNPEGGAGFGADLDVGDVNGDGRGDIAASSHGETVAGLAEAGRAYVFSGTNCARMFTFQSPTPGGTATFGQEVATGDTDFDGNADIAVGAPYEAGGNGRVYLFSGGNGSLQCTFDASPPQGQSQGVQLGQAVAMGDVDGDARDDIIASAQYEDVGANAGAGRAYVFSAATCSGLRPPLGSPNTEAGGQFGAHVAISDVSGDGNGDLFVGAPNEDVAGNINAGRAYVFSGTDASILLTLSAAVPQGYAHFGPAAQGGSIDGHGIRNVVVGARLEDVDENQDQGRVYVFCVSSVDRDCDGYWDGDESLKGSTVLNGASTPEHCDGADNDGDTVIDEEPVGASWDIDGDTVKDCFDTNVDTDGDGIVNTLDADDDMDGRTDAQERKLSTDELGACSTGMSHDGWASDRDRDKDADIGDVIQNFYGKIGSPANYDARSDADGDNDVDIGDVIQLYGGGKAGTKCATLTYTNSTGGPVDDIHIVWSTAIAEVFVARDSQLAGWPSRVISGGGTVLDMERPDGSGDLAAGGTLRMVVRGTNPVVASCQWTLEGVDVGAC